MTATRGMVANTAGNQLFIVVDNGLFSVAPTGVRTQLGTLKTRFGHVGIKLGLNQLVIVDGTYGYIYDLQAKTYSPITAEGFQGSNTVENIGGYFSFIKPNSQLFGLSALEDANTQDPLDFATANASPDKLVGQLVTSNGIIYFGDTSGEFWQINPSPSTIELAIQRNTGATLEVGLMAAQTAKAMDNTAFWLGRDERGAGIVYKMQGLTPVRISTNAIEERIQEAIAAGNDISQACAYAYQQAGHSFYVLQVPGVDTTWTYDAATQQWHERAEDIRGEYAQHRGRYHAYCFGKHLIAGDDGKIYEYDVKSNTNAGDPLTRERVSPHYATPQMNKVFFQRFELDCVVGYGIAGQGQANVMLRYSDDGGFSWNSWRTQTLGAVGEKQAKARFSRLGSANDRVWAVRMSDDAPFAIINAVVQSA